MSAETAQGSTARKIRSRMAIAKRDGHPEAVVEALKAQYKTERLAEFIQQTVESAPPLSDEQIERLRSLLPAPKDGAK